jgi:hypothetical protein
MSWVKAGDREAIHGHQNGVRRMDSGPNERRAYGDTIPDAEICFFGAPCFRTASKEYGRLKTSWASEGSAPVAATSLMTSSKSSERAGCRYSQIIRRQDSR